MNSPHTTAPVRRDWAVCVHTKKCGWQGSMKSSLSFFVPGEPKGQPRPRAFAFHGKARVFDPGTAEHWKSQIAAAAREAKAIPAEPWTEPVALNLSFVMPRPKSHYRSGKHAGQLKLEAPTWHTGKPDADNLAKAVMDSMTTLGFWRDDQQVAQLRIRKIYRSAGESGLAPGCFIIVEEAFEP